MFGKHLVEIDLNGLDARTENSQNRVFKKNV